MPMSSKVSRAIDDDYIPPAEGATPCSATRATTPTPNRDALRQRRILDRPELSLAEVLWAGPSVGDKDMRFGRPQPRCAGGVLWRVEGKRDGIAFTRLPVRSMSTMTFGRHRSSEPRCPSIELRERRCGSDDPLIIT